MRLWIVAIGRLRTGPIRALVEDYAGRSAWPLTVKELEPRKRLSGEALTRHEADLLLGAVPSGATVVALDEAGRDLSSGEFA
ncbi:MAG: 23S rRNA (pseudouridine(1915)-N(3))-methyltransferase RlmH, partial [Alphaproteobacteria bacterium]